jgi:hypothetical protein
LNTGAASRGFWTCPLYKKLVESTEGYAGEVPIIHQAVAVKAAFDALDAGSQEIGDPNS